MDFNNFKCILRNLVSDKDIERLEIQFENFNKEDFNLFLAKRWLSMDENVLQGIADTQLKLNTYITDENQFRMLLYSLPEVDNFYPRYIKKRKS